MNSFESNKLTEAKSLRMLMPLLEERSRGIALTSKARASKWMQEVMGDLLMIDLSGRTWYIEHKAEETARPTLFLELWSNRSLRDEESWKRYPPNPGWMYKSRADLLLYHFINSDELYVLKMFELQTWAFCHESKRWSVPSVIGNISVHPKGRIFDFEEKLQKKHEQSNDTWGRSVPVNVLHRELSPPPAKLDVRQIPIDFGEAA